jgi:large subunit ribosomal protein L18
MKDKKQSRLRRARKARSKMMRLGATRLSVHRTSQHIYAQVLGADAKTVIAATSTLDPKLRKEISNGGNIEAAEAVGKRIASMALEAGVEQVSFDRSGFRYHGRVKALADAAREAGLRI